MTKIWNTIKQEPIVFLFGTWWQYAEGQKTKLIAAFILLTIAFGVRLIEPLILAYLLDYVDQNGVTAENYWYIIFVITWFFWTVLAFSVIRTVGEYLKANVAFISHNNYRKFLFKNIIDRTLIWANDNESGNLIDKTNTSSSALLTFGRRSQKIIDVSVRFVGSYIALVIFFAPALLIVPLVLIPIWLVINTFDKKLIPYYKKLNQIENNISAKIFDSISNLTSVIVLGLRKQVVDALGKKVDEPVETFRKHMVLLRAKWTFTGSFFYLVIAGIMALYVYQSVNTGVVVTVGALSAMFLYLSRMGHGFYDLVGMYGDLIKFKADIENTTSLTKREYIDHVEKDRQKVTSKVSLQIQNFSYDDVQALNNLAIEVGIKEKIALIGQSGSGKTTFLKVLHGLYEGVEGQIQIDGKKVDKQLHEIDLGTTLVPQEPELFSSTVKENITFGLDYSEAQIRNMTDLAMFTDVADSLPKGFDSKINEKGVNLSGGQKQRLALARALLFAQDKDIILLDESTSSVDPETEVQIYQNIFEEFSGKTFIASIHKMNLLKYFDRIVMFENGTITDQGTFDELIDHNQQFRQMWESFIKTQS